MKGNIRKILVIRLSSIGDIVLTSAFIRILRKSFPNSKIDFLLFKQFKAIYENNPQIDQIVCCEKNSTDTKLNVIKSQIIKNQGKYDVILDLQNNALSNRFSTELSDTIYKIDKRRAQKLKLVWLKLGKGDKYKYIHDIYLQVGESLNLQNDNLGLEFWLEEDKQEMIYKAHNRKLGHKGKFNIVVAPGAHFKTKQWGYLNFAHLLRKLAPITESVKIIGGLNDINIAEKIKELNPNIIDMCGKTDLSATCKIIDESDLLITNDTGVMHIAAARQIPVVSFWGSSVRELGFEPFRAPHLIIEEELKCRPCSHIGRNFCPKLHFKCMNAITPEIGYNQIIDYLRKLYL